MADKVSMDRKLLSKEDHEIIYIRGVAKSTIKWMHDGLPVKKEGFVDVYYHPKKSEPSKIHIVMKMNASTLRRLCKAVMNLQGDSGISAFKMREQTWGTAYGGV